MSYERLRLILLLLLLAFGRRTCRGRIRSRLLTARVVVILIITATNLGVISIRLFARSVKLFARRMKECK